MELTSEADYRQNSKKKRAKDVPNDCIRLTIKSLSGNFVLGLDIKAQVRRVAKRCLSLHRLCLSLDQAQKTMHSMHCFASDSQKSLDFG